MIRTLLVDDDALTIELHRTYLERIDGFVVGGECTGARAALSAVLAQPTDQPFDLVLLDLTMPDGSGIDVLRALRARGAAVDVIAITGVRDAESVRQMAALGVHQYLVKPFPFAVFQERLTAYRSHREQARATDGEATQSEIDALLGRATGTVSIPKGLSDATLQKVIAALRAGGAISASEAAERLGMSRVSVRRYLEHLAETGVAIRGARYGARGRPETEYGWNRRAGGRG
ncbi:response regulator [Microbacterium foliorum]|uniref:response regulator n=1 Tax=Microbacterium foliorum TaxID=104336 RepID=UPI001DDA3E76|nr:response regulator [Microbacterium foliorum]CAH0126311.1 Transcriptional regulatory protein DcuR [Microbacterium foliorum]CAH0127779.1 Transcriptional regulatory protein DcuR [Microbacterium foliorum]